MNPGPRSPHQLCGPAMLGLPRGWWVRLMEGEGRPLGRALHLPGGAGVPGGRRRVWESPGADRPPPPSTWSLRPGLHTAQLENVTSLERFPRALPGPRRRARPPRLIFLRQSRSLPRRGMPARQKLGPRSRPLRAAASVPGALPPPRAVRAGGSGAAGPSLPFPAHRAARAYLCGPGRSRGRHPVVYRL